MVTKRDLARKLTMEESIMPERVARILGIGVSQVIKLVLTESTWVPKPRKPRVIR